MNKRIVTSLTALAVASGISGAAVANDDVLKLQKDPANVVMPNYTYNGWNYSALDQVNLNNVKNLTLAWTLQIGIIDSHEASPLVIGDTMYIVSPKPNYVYALDLAKEGVIKWEFRPTMDVALATAQTCCGQQTRGLYYAEGKLFYATLDGQIIALDAKSGEQLWRNVGADIVRGEGMAGNALVAHDMFIGGNEGGEYGVRGKIHAYNINTGRNQWTFYNMGPNNEVGIGPKFKPFYADDKKPNPALDSWYKDSWKTGGGTNWGYYTWDPEADLVYYSTGNCAPWNADYRREWGKIDLDANGGLQSYKNNYCASQMARNATTGELIWAYNITPQDQWDLDEPLNTPLVDLTINGQPRKLALKASRSGYFYAWDRLTGELVNEPWPFRFIDFRGGVDMATGRPKYNIDTIMFTNVEDRRKYTQADPRGGANKPSDYTGTEVVWCPGTNARNWQNDAYSPVTKLNYVAVNNGCGALVMVTGDYKPGDPAGYRLRRTAGGAAAPTIGMDGKPTTVRGQLEAMDPVSRKVAWVHEWGTSDANQLPVSATAGGLLFQGGNDEGVLRAMDATNGKIVWQFRTGSKFNQSPISYSYGGKQFIAVIASSAATNTAVAANAGANAAARYARSGTTLYVFKLP